MPISEYDVIILGAGMSGIAMGHALRQAGRHDFLILEEATGIGGTWWHNRYPGAQCDVPSHLYCFSFAPNPNWSHVYARGDEIQRYADDCVDRLGLRAHLCLGTKIESAAYIPESGRWLIKTGSGQEYSARHFVASMGPLHRPRLPDHVQSFHGTILHTARWDSSIDLTGKRVAVIGTAASAVQLIPAIVDRCQHLDVYQRSPSWVVPRGDQPYSVRMRRWLAKPLIGRVYRWALYVGTEATFPAFRHRGFMPRVLRWVATHHLAKHVRDPALRARLTPNYPVGCKRVLLSDEFFPSIQKDNVTVHSAAHGFAPSGIINANGETTPADVLICATGFDTLAPLGQIKITGLSGQTLAQRWAEGPEADRGTTVDGFPNFWLLLGPNTGTGHTSVLIPIEAQAQYISRCIQQLDSTSAKAMVVRPEVLRNHNNDLQLKLKKTVWASPQCSSWYKTSEGRVLGTFPGFISQFSFSLRRPRLGDYQFL